MEINKQLFEDVLSGKLKGTFVFRNQLTCNSDKLTRNTTSEYKFTHPYSIMDRTYKSSGMFNFSGSSGLDIIDFIPSIPDPNMKENELTIEIPNGKIVDWDESKKQNKIVFRDKQPTYEGIIEHAEIGSISNIHYFSDDQMRCLLAKNRLANVAKYLNDGWKPYKGDHIFTIMHYGDSRDKLIISEHYFGTGENLVLFKTQKDAQQAIEILGEETVKLALEPLGI